VARPDGPAPERAPIIGRPPVAGRTAGELSGEPAGQA
jgi:hypothetical protein